MAVITCCTKGLAGATGQIPTMTEGMMFLHEIIETAAGTEDVDTITTEEAIGAAIMDPTETQGIEIQETEIQETEIQETEIQEKEIQETEIQEKEI